MVRSNEFDQPIGEPVAGWKPLGPELADKLCGTFVKLLPLDAKYAPELMEAFSKDDGSMWTYLNVGPFLSIEELDKTICSLIASGKGKFYSIVSQKTGKAVGLVSYLRIFPEVGSVEIGYVTFSPAMRRNCMGTETIFLMATDAFKRGYRRLEWKCDSLNARSRNAALRYGFQPEGVHRNAVVYKGRSRDTAWFSILDSEWYAGGIESSFQQWLSPENFNSSGEQKQPLRAFRTK